MPAPCSTFRSRRIGSIQPSLRTRITPIGSTARIRVNPYPFVRQNGSTGTPLWLPSAVASGQRYALTIFALSRCVWSKILSRRQLRTARNARGFSWIVGRNARMHRPVSLRLLRLFAALQVVRSACPPLPRRKRKIGPYQASEPRSGQRSSRCGGCASCTISCANWSSRRGADCTSPAWRRAAGHRARRATPLRSYSADRNRQDQTPARPPG